MKFRITNDETTPSHTGETVQSNLQNIDRKSTKLASMLAYNVEARKQALIWSPKEVNANS
jgi:hypothetical protein